LRSIKQSAFFPGPKTRNAIGDFAVVAAVLLMCFLAHVAFSTVEIETLKAPDGFATTYQCCTADCRTSYPDDCPSMEPYGTRPWLVNLFDLNGNNWIPFFAAVPAALAFILIFLDNGITWHLINAPENKITHGHAYNYDTVIIAISVLVNSFMGLPWLCAATVRSINHVKALATQENGRITFMQETRLTHFFIHLLILVTLFAMNTLKLIPLAVLYGVFLYMGLTALAGNQFYERFLMLFQQPSKYPKRVYTEFVKGASMHKYTLIQILLFVLLYVVKTIKKTAIAFPLIIAACIPLRIWLLPRIFSAQELVFLDGDDQAIEAAIGQLDKQTEMDKV